MKNVILLGDSIRIGYDKSVKKSLENVANVVFPEDNCRFASYMLRYIPQYFCGLQCENVDVLHWNAGLWDCLRQFGEDVHTPIEIYTYYIDRICKRIKKLCPNAKVIFATCTSVLSEKMPDDFKRYNEEIAEYNAAAVEVVKKYGFEVNDLYTLSLSLPESAHSDSVHYYTSEGTEAFTKQVLSYVTSALGIDGEVEYKEVIHTNDPVGI